jgi:tetratricopeptide (TPR) repeat protein
MSENQNTANTAGKGKAFFDRADQVAETSNWDFAIEMYVEGIRREPTNLQRGYKPLRDVSLKRKMQGGKGPGMREKMKMGPGKDPVDSAANAAFLMAKDPGNTAYMLNLFKAAMQLEDKDLILWIGDLLMEVMNQAKKPNKQTCLTLSDAFESIKDYRRAIDAANIGLRVTPDDAALEDRIGRLSAEYTIQQGKYDQEGSFTKGVKDMDVQKQWMEEDAMVKSAGYLEQKLAKAKAEYEADPTMPGKVNGYVDALLAFDQESYEYEAIDVLDKAYRDTGAYQFKVRIGDIKSKQYARRFREMKERGDMDAAKQVARDQLEFEIEEFAERAQNYPTDLSIKYELGRRQFLKGNFDDAIAALQQAQRDPKRHVIAMNYLGQAFMKKQWWREAVDTFSRVLQTDLTEERAKELRYNLALCHEHMGNLQAAQDEFSRVAQTDFNFKDVRQRLEDVRKKMEQGEA